jgi:hypothetical protein
MRQLNELLADKVNGRNRVYHFAEHADELSDGLYDVLSVLDEWLYANKTEEGLRVAADVIVGLNRRVGVEVLKRHSDLTRASHVQRLADVQLIVQRASL